jgi:cytochrome c553
MLVAIAGVQDQTKRKNISWLCAAALTDDDMHNISYWASKQAKPGLPRQELQTLALGDNEFTAIGIADRQSGCIAGCHGPTGAGIPAQSTSSWAAS